MPPEAPSWWYRKTGLRALLLAPAAFVWQLATRLRWKMVRPYRAKIPVICIGNLTAGGAGKTPAALAIARILQQAGERPVFLTRGYGGQQQGPHLVDRKTDTAAQVGDEPLLLARVAPTIVSADRAKGAVRAEDMNASVIVMDDGFQNPSLAKDLSLLVVDRALGIGNGWVIPSGPMRADLGFQLARAQALVPVGQGDGADAVIECARQAGLSVLEAEIAPHAETAWLKGKPVVAFAGIGNPDKFFQMLEELGASVTDQAVYPDHHVFSEQDAKDLMALAAVHGAQLVTTEKDMARLDGGGSFERLRKAARALPVRMRFKDQGKVKRLLLRVTKPKHI